VGRNEGGGTGLSQRAAWRGGDRDGGDREGLSRCSPATGCTRWGLSLRPKPDDTEAFQ